MLTETTREIHDVHVHENQDMVRGEKSAGQSVLLTREEDFVRNPSSGSIADRLSEVTRIVDGSQSHERKVMVRRGKRTGKSVAPTWEDHSVRNSSDAIADRQTLSSAGLSTCAHHNRVVFSEDIRERWLREVRIALRVRRA
jgi:hypothetical protein